ncbi:Hypothetical predicted protein, partial [Drosophila guanche]
MPLILHLHPTSSSFHSLLALGFLSLSLTHSISLCAKEAFLLAFYPNLSLILCLSLLCFALSFLSPPLCVSLSDCLCCPSPAYRHPSVMISVNRRQLQDVLHEFDFLSDMDSRPTTLRRLLKERDMEQLELDQEALESILLQQQQSEQQALHQRQLQEQQRLQHFQEAQRLAILELCEHLGRKCQLDELEGLDTEQQQEQQDQSRQKEKQLMIERSKQLQSQPPSPPTPPLPPPPPQSQPSTQTPLLRSLPLSISPVSRPVTYPCPSHSQSPLAVMPPTNQFQLQHDPAQTQSSNRFGAAVEDLSRPSAVEQQLHRPVLTLPPVVLLGGREEDRSVPPSPLVEYPEDDDEYLYRADGGRGSQHLLLQSSHSSSAGDRFCVEAHISLVHITLEPIDASCTTSCLIEEVAEPEPQPETKAVAESESQSEAYVESVLLETVVEKKEEQQEQ